MILVLRDEKRVMKLSSLDDLDFITPTICEPTNLTLTNGAQLLTAIISEMIRVRVKASDGVAS